MGARLMNAKKKAKRQRHKKGRNQSPPPAKDEYNGGRQPAPRRA
jgi:hypothetical protein